ALAIPFLGRPAEMEGERVALHAEPQVRPGEVQVRGEVAVDDLVLLDRHFDADFVDPPQRELLERAAGWEVDTGALGKEPAHLRRPVATLPSDLSEARIDDG